VEKVEQPSKSHPAKQTDKKVYR